MSAYPKSELRAMRRTLGTRKTRRANTKPGKMASGTNRPYRASPATQIAALKRESAA